MKAIQMTAVGGPEVLAYRDVDNPSIQNKSEMIVRIKAAGLNPVDTKQRGRGTWSPSELPQILGIEGSGIIEETGSGVKKFKKGDEIFYFHGGLGIEPGNYAEYIVIDEMSAVSKPDAMSFEQAAATPCAVLTAWESLFLHGKLREGQTVLIHAGAGGVGHMAIQLARHKGVRVATTVSGNEKKEMVEKLGAEKAIQYKKNDFVEETLDWTDGKGVDVVFDLVGKDTFYRSFPCIKFYGCLVTALGPDPENADWKEARLRNIRVNFSLILSPGFYKLVDMQKEQVRILQEAARMAEARKLEVHVSKTFPLENAREAHKLLQEGHTMGKLVLIP
jgi:NADPH2:quinone reductase